jgi:hypothetical protein
MSIPWSQETGYGITEEGRVVKWDSEDGEFDDRKISKSVFQDLSNREQERLIDQLGKEDRTFFGIFGQAIDPDWKMLDRDGNTVRVGDYNIPEPEPEPDPVAAVVPEVAAVVPEVAAVVPEVAGGRTEAPQGEKFEYEEFIGRGGSQGEGQGDLPYKKGGLAIKRNRLKVNGKGLARRK